MNYKNLKKQIEKGLYPSAKSMQDNLDYAYYTRNILTQTQYKELSDLLAIKEDAKYQ